MSYEESAEQHIIEKQTANPPKSSASEILSHWRIQEGLFQGYRRLFLTLETVLLSVAALIVSREVPESVAIVLLLSLLVIGIWIVFGLYPIVQKRGELVFYWQAKLLKAERGETILLPFKEMKDFQKDSNHPFKIDSDYVGLSEGKHLARKRLNLGLPVIVLIAWSGVVVAFLFKLLKL